MARWTPSTAAAFVALATEATVGRESEIGWEPRPEPSPRDAGVTLRPPTTTWNGPPVDVGAYFPPHLFEPETMRAFVTEWYGRPLLKMGEPSLWRAAHLGARTLRFYCLPSFRPAITVRVERAEVAAQVVATLGSGSDAEPGPARLRTARAIAIAEWDKVTALLAAASFDTMPAFDRDSAGLDGAQWIVERADGGEYRLVSRWSPRAVGLESYRRACEAFLALAGPEITEGADL